jgi:hypothetical protein
VAESQARTSSITDEPEPGSNRNSRLRAVGVAVVNPKREESETGDYMNRRVIPCDEDDTTIRREE